MDCTGIVGKHNVAVGNRPYRQGTHVRHYCDQCRASQDQAMTDDRTKTVPQDAKLISLTEDYEIAYWMKRFAINDEGLADAVRRVGHSVAALEAHLKT
jgi:hypothetical protein